MSMGACDEPNGPQTLNHFIGQAAVVGQVRVALEAAWNDHARLPHMLLCGPPGLGKTELARVLAKEMGTELIEALGQNLTEGAMAGFLMSGADRSVFLIDEVHGLRREPQMLLLRALTDRKVFLRGPAFGRAVQVVDLPPLTLLAATTDEYRLAKPLRQRFEMVLRFEFYSPSELEQLLIQHARRRRWSFDAAVPGQIALRSQGTPRQALHLLAACHRTSRCVGAETIGLDHFRQACAVEGIDELGLNRIQQQYLRILAETGAPVPPMNLSARLDLPLGTLRDVIESFPVRAGLVDRGEHGRVLTAKGRAHAAMAGRACALPAPD